MHRKLAIIAVAGLGLSVIFLSSAFAVGGKVLGQILLNFADSDLPLCPQGAATSATSIRTLDWLGGDAAVVALTARVHYRAGSGTQLVVRGPAGLLAHLRQEDGALRMDCHPPRNMRGDPDLLDVTLPGRVFQRFEMRGVGNLDLAGIDQPALELNLKGAGDVRAEGKTGLLTVDVRGLGDMKLGALVATNADLSIRGAGNVEIAAEDRLSVDIRGAGDVRLTREPKNLETDIRGAGSIYHADGSRVRQNGRGRHARDRDI